MYKTLAKGALVIALVASAGALRAETLQTTAPILACLSPLGENISRAAIRAPHDKCVAAMQQFVDNGTCTVYPAGTQFNTVEVYKLPPDLGGGITPLVRRADDASQSVPLMLMAPTGTVEEFCETASKLLRGEGPEVEARND